MQNACQQPTPSGRKIPAKLVRFDSGRPFRQRDTHARAKLTRQTSRTHYSARKIIRVHLKIQQGNDRQARYTSRQYANIRHDIYPRARNLRLSRALHHVRTGVRHGALHAHLRNVPAGADHAVRVPGTTRSAIAHLQPGFHDAAQEELRRGEEPRAPGLAHVRHRPALDAALPRLGGSGENPQAAAPAHAHQLRRTVVVDLPRRPDRVRLHRLRIPRRLHRRAHAHAGGACGACSQNAHAAGRFVGHSQPHLERCRRLHPHQPLELGSRRHERHIHGLRLPHEGRAAPPRHDQLPAHEGLAELPRDRQPDLPRLRAQLRHVRRQRLRVQEPLRSPARSLARSEAADPRHPARAGPYLGPHLRAERLPASRRGLHARVHHGAQRQGAQPHRVRVLRPAAGRRRVLPATGQEPGQLVGGDFGGKPRRRRSRGVRQGPLHDGRVGRNHRGRAFAPQLRTVRPVLHDGHPQANGGQRARNGRVRAAFVRARELRSAPGGADQPHGAVFGRGIHRVRQPGKVRLQAARPHVRGASRAHDPALVEAHHELREHLHVRGRDGGRHLRRSARPQPHQRRARHPGSGHGRRHRQAHPRGARADEPPGRRPVQRHRPHRCAAGDAQGGVRAPVREHGC